MANENYYYKLMAKIGLTKKFLGATGHGLRAEYLENEALLLRMVPATLGGDINQLPRDQIDVINKKNSQKAGHTRGPIVGAYYGGIAQLKDNAKAKAAKKAADPNYVDDSPTVGEVIEARGIVNNLNALSKTQF